MNLDDIISFINQCDDLPPECFDGTWACTCESFLFPVVFFGLVGAALGTMWVIRQFGNNEGLI